MRISKSVAGIALFAAGAATVVAVAVVTRTGTAHATPASTGLWQVYDQSLKQARYIDLTHSICRCWHCSAERASLSASRRAH